MKRLLSLFVPALVSIRLVAAGPSQPTVKAEVIVYGGTPGGVMAAVAAARQGHTVALIDINNHVGGMISGGLVNTDIGDRKTVGGLSAEFLKRAVQYYADTNGPDSPQVAACKNGRKFEPHIAELVFDQMLKEQHITVWKRHRYRSVTLEGNRITGLVADDLAGKTTRTFAGDVFVDASYEGDLMAGAKVPYRVGRESTDEFGEKLAGISVGPDKGKADKGVMAYNFRVSITGVTENRVLFPKPGHYDPEPWRKKYSPRIASGKLKTFGKLFISKPGANGKHDANWCDLTGGSADYPEGDWETRTQIEARHRDYFLSLLYWLQNDSGLPEAFHASAQQWGLPKDEFADSGHFPFQLYVREARRMVGSYVLRESDLTQNRSKPDGVCAGSYGVDCHVVQILTVNGKPAIDRTPHILVKPYDIPYACLTPREISNLLVPVCCSATHVAYCSLRMEPTYMMLGHAAGDAAHLAIKSGTTVQKVDVKQLRELLRKEGAVLDAASAATVEEKPEVKSKSAAPKTSVKPVYAPIKDEPGLPRVLLIGDSVSIGYTLPLRELLKGRANVHRIPGNGSSTGHGLSQLKAWLGDGKWDVIHFNWGIHDLKFVKNGKPQVEPDDYDKNLRRLVAELKATGARLIWATTTPIPDGELGPGRAFGKVPDYNAIAARVMAENGVTIDDLNAAVAPHLAELQKPKDVHYRPEGYNFLAKQAAASIEAALPLKN